MKNFKLAVRYARALSDVVKDDAHLEDAAASLGELGHLVATHAGLRGALSNPSVLIEKRAAILDGILEAIECHHDVAGLARVLLRRRRMEFTPDIATIFNELSDKRLNRITARVTTARSLTDDQQEKICRALEKYSGKSVRIEEHIDESLLAGVVAQIDGTVIDGSLKTRLSRMKTALMAQGT